MKNLFTLLFIAALLFPFSLFSQDCDLTPNTVGAPTWDRPIGTGPGISGLGPVNYHIYGPFTVSATGAYDINSVQTGGWDGYLHLYENSFNPLDQLTGLIAGNDDGAGGIGTSEILGQTLTAGTDYFLITSGFAAGDNGDAVTMFSGGPGVIICPSSAVACPPNGVAIDDLDGPCGTFAPNATNDPNGGPNATALICTNAIQALPQNGFLNGVMQADGGLRDTDWFSLDLSGLDFAEVTVCAPFDFDFFMINPPCPTAVVGVDPAITPFSDSDDNDGVFDNTPANTPATFFMGIADGTLFPPGTTAFMFVSSQNFNGNPCGSGTNDYTLSVLSNLNQNLVPTMGEWGMIFLVLLTLTFGAVFMTARRWQLAGEGGNISFSSTFRNMPFEAGTYGKFLIAVFVLVAVGFSLAILAFGYTLTSADIPGVLVCVPLLSYMSYLFFGEDRD